MTRPLPARTPVATLGWTCLFVAILGHLPALASWFAQDDWDFLARAVGTAPTPDWPIRPFTTVVTWEVFHTVFGLSAAPHHVVALLLLGLCAVLTVRIGARMGLGPAGAALAGLVVAITPTAIRPIAWASAASELWAAFFALLALDLWTHPRRAELLPFLGAVAAGLSLASKEAGLLLPLALALASRWWPSDEPARIRRARPILLAALGVAAAITAWRVAQAFRGGPLGAYALAGPDEILRNLLLFGSWIAGPPSFPGPERLAALAVGGVLWAGWGAWALRRHRQGSRLSLFALLWALGSVLPVVGLASHLEPYYMVLAVPAFGWWIGDLLGSRLEEPVARLRHPVLPLLGLAVVATASSAWVTHSTMSARLPDGRLADPILRRGAIAADVARLLHRIPDLGDHPQVAVLQATRVRMPEGMELPEDGEVFVTSPVHTALRGETGLQVLLPEGTRGDWVTRLDGLSVDALVLLDAGDTRLRVLGPVENARLYSALIAVSAGQFARARHDLWSVLGKLGHEVRFAFRPDALPITPAELDSQAPDFVRFLQQDREPSSRRILKLFGQLYEAVRGRSLVDEDWLELPPPSRLGG